MSTVLPAASASASPSASASGHSSSEPSGGSAARSNLPLPDQLAQVRAEIKRLEGLEIDLRNELMAHPELREGASWLAEIKTMKRTQVDLKELKHFHPSIVDEFTYPREITYVALSGVTSDGEIVNARAMRKLEADQQ